jgi:hypothetical protein
MTAFRAPSTLRVAAALTILAASVLTALPALAAPVLLPLPAPLPPVRGLTLLVAVHILGVCFGLGGATMLDFWILRWLRWGGLPGEIARIFNYVSKVCTVGLLLLWLSGLGFLALYAAESPEKLGNPKLWAKVTVVLVLTLNGLVIHHAVLPGVLRDVGRPMFQGLPGPRAGVFLVSGAVSGVSWYAAFALGVMRELNGTVAYGLLIGLWLTAIVAASLGGGALWLGLRKGRRAERATRPRMPLPSPPEAAIGPRIPASQFVRVGTGPARS